MKYLIVALSLVSTGALAQTVAPQSPPSARELATQSALQDEIMTNLTLRERLVQAQQKIQELEAKAKPAEPDKKEPPK